MLLKRSCIVVALGVSVVPLPATAQEADPAVSLPALAATLHESSRTRADAYITALAAGDSAGRYSALLHLVGDTAAAAFYLAAVRQEPNAALRSWGVMTLDARYLPFWRGYAPLPSFLGDLVTSDPDSAVAIEAFSKLALLRPLDARERVDQRIGPANLYAQGAPVAGWLADLQERAIGLVNRWITPLFMRTPPAMFAAVPTGTPRIRVLAFGDWGTGLPQQTAVAAAMRAYHARHCFSFGITVGDNFYLTGLPSPTHERWQTQYESLYSPMKIKLYPTFGNHDRYDGDSPAAEIARTYLSPTWRMPSAYYSFTAGPAQFFAVDGNALSVRQLAWLKGALERSTARWKIVYGHFPIDVAADVGAGYTAEMREKLLPILRGRADLYVAGHHHSTQHLQPMDGLNLIITGSGGAPGYPSDSTKSNALFARTTPGFAVLEVDEHTLTVRFINDQNESMYTATLHKPSR